MSDQDYLGEKIALYFALIGHYTAWLGPLSVLGLIMSIDQIIEWNLDGVLAPYFSIFVSFWAVSTSSIVLQHVPRCFSSRHMIGGKQSQR